MCVFWCVLLCLERFKPFRVWMAKVSEQTATLRSETLETIESQTQAERLYEGLSNMAVALVATQSMMHNLDDDVSVTGRKAKHQCLGDGLTIVEAEEQHGPSTRANSGARASHWKEISAAANDKLMAVLAEFTFNLNLHLTKMNESMDNFAVDVRNEIEQELRGR